MIKLEDPSISTLVTFFINYQEPINISKLSKKMKVGAGYSSIICNYLLRHGIISIHDTRHEKIIHMTEKGEKVRDSILLLKMEDDPMKCPYCNEPMKKGRCSKCHYMVRK